MILPVQDKPQPPSSWSGRYGEQHRLTRITEFPKGITAPRKVRIYSRAAHYVLQVWDPSLKRTVCERIDNDLLSALIRARELDERVTNYRRSGHAGVKLTHERLVELFTNDLDLRSNAGEIDPKTVQRYRDALKHYLAFANHSDHGLRTNNVQRVDRAFQMALATYLNRVEVTPNGRAQGKRRPMSHAQYVIDVVRAMFCWAADPLRGNLLGDGFVNPFKQSSKVRRVESNDPTAEPAISLSMATEFLACCDRWQLAVFAGLLFWGLRPSELGWLFQEDLDADWLRIRCHPDLEYLTKGRRDKRVPLLPTLRPLWPTAVETTVGLLFRSRSFSKTPAISLEVITREYRRRTAKVALMSKRRTIRDQLLLECGAISYDRIQSEFQRVARLLNWSPAATLKGFRHLFATTLENGGMPEFYRRYLMGQSPGRSAIVTYTHLNQLQQQYTRVISGEMQSLVSVVERRWSQL